MKRLVSAIILLGLFGFKASNPLYVTLDGVANRHPEATFGFYAYDITDGKGVLAYNSDKNLAPASTLKLLTTISALEILGPHEKFVTTILYTGNIEGGILKGDLIIQPSGDPTMGSRYFKTKDAFENVADEMIKSGIERVEGKLILNLEGFESERIPNNWSFDDLGNYYGASLAPLNWSDNTTYITFKSGKVGGKTEVISLYPPVAELEFINDVKAANISYDNAYVFGAPRQYNRTIRGEIPANKAKFEIKASVPEPELFAMQCLVSKLRKSGIEVPYGAVSIVNELDNSSSKQLLIKIESPELIDIIAVTNMESNNLFAEALLKMIAHRKTGTWSREKGIEVIKDFWKEKGVDLSAANLYDGSGLSRFNGISPKQLVEVMKYEQQSANYNELKASLPIAGVSGSLQTMLKGTKAENNLMAKSGYIEKVRSYCGYLTAANGNLVAFSVVVNNYNCGAVEARKELELIMKTLAD